MHQVHYYYPASTQSIAVKEKEFSLPRWNPSSSKWSESYAKLVTALHISMIWVLYYLIRLLLLWIMATRRSFAMSSTKSSRARPWYHLTHMMLTWSIFFKVIGLRCCRPYSAIQNSHIWAYLCIARKDPVPGAHCNARSWWFCQWSSRYEYIAKWSSASSRLWYALLDPSSFLHQSRKVYLQEFCGVW